MAVVEVVVSVEDRYLDQLPEVARRLEGAGLQVEQALDALGAVTGQVEEARIPALAQVEGVSSVERSREIHLSPPTSDIQ